MKQSIIGYVTALTNVHADMLDKIPTNTRGTSVHGMFLNELNALLDFIEDIPEENPLVINLNSIEETEFLRKRIRELEESCESMCEVEKNLHSKMVLLIQENEQLKQKLQINGGKIDG